MGMIREAYWTADMHALAREVVTACEARCAALGVKGAASVRYACWSPGRVSVMAFVSVDGVARYGKTADVPTEAVSDAAARRRIARGMAASVTIGGAAKK